MKKGEIYRRERENGLTCPEIAQKYGVSRQRVYQCCAKSSESHFNKWTKERCIYIHLRNWLNDNRITLSELIRRMDWELLPGNYNAVRAWLNGKTYPIKKNIDKLIEITGIPYEKLWIIGEESK